MELTRFEFSDGICKKPHTGILAGLNEAFEDEFINEVSLAWHHFCDKLPIPACNFKSYDTISYFTIDGLNDFANDIHTILMHILIEGMNFERIDKSIRNDDPDILYQDKWQVVMKR